MTQHNFSRLKKEDKLSTYFESDSVAAEFAESARRNQRKLTSDLKPHYELHRLPIGLIRRTCWRDTAALHTRFD
jgi:hypothetical protein